MKKLIALAVSAMLLISLTACGGEKTSEITQNQETPTVQVKKVPVRSELYDMGGNLMATIVTPHHRPQMATVRPGVMPLPTADTARRGEIVTDSAGVAPGLVELLQEVRDGGGSALQKAEVIVSVGRGIGQRKNMKLAEELAAKLGGVMGVSRPLVEMGWATQDRQIGQTGTAVAPKLLIACGISGAIQHLAGIAGAKTVVAVNTDPNAPIFAAADYKLVADAAGTLRALIAALE